MRYPKRIAALTAAALVAWPAQQSLQAQGGDPDQVESVLTRAGPISVRSFAAGLKNPWGMAFLPDGRLLVTEKGGNLRAVDASGKVSRPIRGTPQVYAQGQGGLMDVALDPQFATNRYIYLSYAESGPGAGAATAVGRGEMRGDSIVNFTRLFLQEPWIDGGLHFGNRIAFSREGHLFLAMGERFQFQPAQDPSNHLGAVVRLNRDGTVPRDNPFVGRAGHEPEIWSYGHRNIESAAVDPATGHLWVVEMGPLGGDELNRVEAGGNYGWPAVSWGIHYDGKDIPDPPTQPRFMDAVRHWSPVHSPSGMIFYSGSMFPAWRGQAMFGSLSQGGVVRVGVRDGRVVEEEFIPLNTRIRDVEQGPDGALYLATDGAEGKIWKVVPLGRS